MSALAARELDVGGMRPAAATLLGLGAALSLLPGHEGIPCPLRMATGVPCPFCGMTTSVEETFRLDLGAALAANPAGIAAVVAAGALLALRPTAVRISPLVILSALVATWIFELVRFSIL
jgi:hypothetical protein